ncbi:MAG: pentapeptide repeat-containing protein [Cyanobacteria bacterium P01_H01_bin.150]
MENTYLKNTQVRQLLVMGQGEGKNLDRLNLRGVNLQGAILANASFIGTDLSEANLKDADLSRAILKQTQLDGTDFTGATLTGATIEDWGITNRTKLHGVQCDYVFMQLVEKCDETQNRHRRPGDWNKNFAPNEFVDFITPLVQTFDLYHKHVDDPRLIVIAFNELCKNHPEAKIESIAVERRGKNRDGLLIKAETSPYADHSRLHAEYFNTYNNFKNFSLEAVQALLKERGQPFNYWREFWKPSITFLKYLLTILNIKEIPI